MKNVIKTLVNIIDKEINWIMNHRGIDKNDYGVEEEFDYGKIIYDVSYNEKEKKYPDDWDMCPFDIEIEIEVKNVEITNENGKLLTNLSNEVFNQLEEVYTNY